MDSIQSMHTYFKYGGTGAQNTVECLQQMYNNDWRGDRNSAATSVKMHFAVMSLF
jgi:hypothetical protein